MYVCLCHGFTDRHIRTAIQDGGAESAAAVYQHFDCAPRCGRCVPFVRDMVRAARDDLAASPIQEECPGGCVCADG